ncbi:transmembrane protein 254-like isoform X2 [Xenia sp. Carnegie-2017]|uniref:transmembrane protein 254-like isoform X2 n=1 Tax=Xenia sp. Carnegie-2017 TaxID=2897299 RepID=UPI001F049F10|nr:transmembrane protein 254-like isoform X2 [Xenia sp. Carnegie-2017]
MKMQEKLGKKFRSVSLFEWMLGISWIVSHGVLSFFPKVLPCQQLGEMGDVFCYYVKEYNYLIKVVYIAVIAIHVLESLYSWVLSSNLGCSLWDQMKWFLQTFIVGYFSLSIIRKMNNEQMKRKH